MMGEAVKLAWTSEPPDVPGDYLCRYQFFPDDDWTEVRMPVTQEMIPIKLDASVTLWLGPIPGHEEMEARLPGKTTRLADEFVSLAIEEEDRKAKEYIAKHDGNIFRSLLDSAPFITVGGTDGEYRVVLKFRDIHQAHEFHRMLIHAIENAKEEGG